MTPRLVSRIGDIKEEDWNSLQGTQTAFTCHQFLRALETSGSVDASNGWLPCHLIWEEQGELLGAMPLYRKYHSYGEYVFDWSWAEAYQQTGQAYYPKLLCAIPFTPVPGPRLFNAKHLDQTELWRKSLAFLEKYLKTHQLSSLHLLFSDTDLSNFGNSIPLLGRQDVQFIWRNQAYQRFDDFLSTLKSSKRKQIRRERRKVEESNVQVFRLAGDAIDIESLKFFYQCYRATYMKRSGHDGYLSEAFFLSLLKHMPESLVLILAQQAGENVASALFFIDNHQLSGRYWGCMKEVDCLHFELCYYQGIDLCIEHNLATFNPGTQGEHKLVRGFEPMRTQSFHLIGHPQFHEAVRRALSKEDTYMDAYEQSAKSHLPFRET